MSAPTALYRRYRPDSFATVIGQEHVTAPLMAALDKNRVNHAYLFSGPRGCGKTTSARILARCLNCAKGPTSHPCGECDSCVELARGGAGSLDVIEIDAASHGGVDDARDLRERATFAPIRDRYKIFIIDEAHMVTSAGFNALLKIVEEPPEHIKFIFATTEPDKVIGTIRSRTHHYPFRLVPPEPLMAYLAHLCEAENVAVAPGVLSLVVRAGGGSVRDSLSVLDQLMAGAGAAGLDYDLAVDLLGYTHSSLLDDVVEALAASDSATVFKSVDRVIQTGHDPRRFVEDLLERFRDLIIVQAMPESAHAILRGTPDELIARMQTQAAQLGAAELSRAADVTNAAFNEMTGASSPRLHLELLGARLLLPGADSSTRGMATRLDQLERRLNYGGAPAAPAASSPAAPAAPSQEFPVQGSTPAPTSAAPVGSAPADSSGGGLAAVRAQLARAKEAAGAEVAARHSPSQEQPQAAAPEPAPVAPQPSRTWDDLPTPEGTPVFESPYRAEQAPVEVAPAKQAPATAVPANVAPAAQAQQVQPPAPAEVPAAAPAENSGGSSSGIEVIRRAWPEILGALRSIRMASWVIVNQNVVPQTFDGQELRVGLPSTGLISTFSNGGHLANLQQAINTVLGLSVQILPVDGEAPSPRASAEPNPKVQTRNPSPQREGSGSAAQEPTPVPAPAPAPTPVSAPDTAPRDSWGLPTAAPTATPVRTAETQAPAVAQPPVTVQPAVRDQDPITEPAPASTKVPATEQAPAVEQEPWDGPTEPSDPWDEPEAYPPADYVPVDPYQQSPPAVAEPVPAYSPPKVSPISAWTTGWDTPVAEVAVVAPVESEAPRRSAMLAEQIAQQSSPPSTQDWGVSLGQASREKVADPGWGAISNAPDWAQDTGSSETPTAPAQAAAEETPPEPKFNAALPVAGSPLGASSTYPTVRTVSVPLSQTAVDQPAAAEQAPAQATGQAQPDPASDIAAGNQAGEKLSMYQRLANSPAAQAARAHAPSAVANAPYVEDVPSPDDVTIEESGVVGQAAVERILGGVLIEERPLNNSN
ncbi:DNA polymerase III subunit gamma and tau [Arthrobacter alpinus]|uniref:DNA polymerase III subunit gamma and tau n=1 Tax=Arthrobacter alpinus TaxID=656366 RepID=UPI0009F9929F|nr:DNA polymerase III subunit gamma and tau [Arthrobacter alpinus]